MNCLTRSCSYCDETLPCLRVLCHALQLARVHSQPRTVTPSCMCVVVHFYTCAFFSLPPESRAALDHAGVTPAEGGRLHLGDCGYPRRGRSAAGARTDGADDPRGALLPPLRVQPRVAGREARPQAQCVRQWPGAAMTGRTRSKGRGPAPEPPKRPLMT